jgi:hypothetical protein
VEPVKISKPGVLCSWSQFEDACMGLDVVSDDLCWPKCSRSTRWPVPQCTNVIVSPLHLIHAYTYTPTALWDGLQAFGTRALVI